MHECLDIETEGRAHTHYIFAIELLQNGRLSSVVQTTELPEYGQEQDRETGLQKQNSHFFFFLAVLSDDGEQSHGFEASQEPREFRQRVCVAFKTAMVEGVMTVSSQAFEPNMIVSPLVI